MVFSVQSSNDDNRHLNKMFKDSIIFVVITIKNPHITCKNSFEFLLDGGKILTGPFINNKCLFLNGFAQLPFLCEVLL